MGIVPDPVPCSSDDVLSDTLGMYLSSEYLFIFFFLTQERMCVYMHQWKWGVGRKEGVVGKEQRGRERDKPTRGLIS